MCVQRAHDSATSKSAPRIQRCFTDVFLVFSWKSSPGSEKALSPSEFYCLALFPREIRGRCSSLIIVRRCLLELVPKVKSGYPSVTYLGSVKVVRRPRCMSQANTRRTVYFCLFLFLCVCLCLSVRAFTCRLSWRSRCCANGEPRGFYSRTKRANSNPVHGARVWSSASKFEIPES